MRIIGIIDDVKDNTSIKSHSELPLIMVIVIAIVMMMMMMMMMMIVPIMICT